VRKFSSAMSPDYSRTMLAQTKLAQCLWRQGKLDEALAVASAAEATARSLFTGAHPKLGQALRVLATVHRERGEYAQADALYEEALVVYAQAEDRELDWVTRTEVSYAQSLLAQQKFAAARAMLERRDAELAASGGDHADSRREITAMLERVAAAER
jgi:tetratricopeptide (TPR) repeat protein